MEVRLGLNLYTILVLRSPSSGITGVCYHARLIIFNFYGVERILSRGCEWVAEAERVKGDSRVKSVTA